MKKELTEESIQNYLDYLVSIRICYGNERCHEHFKYAMNGAKHSFSAADCKKLKAELLRRIDDEYKRRIGLSAV